MNGKIARFAAALLPLCFLTAQQRASRESQQGGRKSHQPPSPEVMRRINEEGQRMRAHAIAINDLAGRIQTPNDARKLVDLIAAEFSESLPKELATSSIRDSIAHAEYAAAADSDSLIAEQPVADAWNHYLQKIGAPQE